MIEHPHIHIEDGVPYIEGTRVPAQRLHYWHFKVSFETLFKRYPHIPRSHILNAIAFFYDNPDMIRNDYP